MKYVSVIEDKTYLLWQQEVQAQNLLSLGEKNLVVVVLHEGEPSTKAKELEKLCEVRYYQNLQLNRSYIPSNKPYGVRRLLEESPEYGENMFLLDSDVIFRELPSLSEMDDPSGMYASDCSSYLGWSYVESKYPSDRLLDLFSISGITHDKIREIDKVSGGAQYFFKTITAEFCQKVELDSLQIYYHMCKSRDEVGSEIQVWTAEMWAWLWNAALRFNLYTPKELEFCWATDHETRWEQTKILHLAGVTSKEMGLFYKGAYTNNYPWDTTDFDYITRRDTCSWVYFTKMMEYRTGNEGATKNN